MFSIDIDATLNSGTVVRLAGELDIAGSRELRSVLHALTSDDLVIDLSALSFIDSTGLNVLMGAYRAAVRRGRRFSIRAPGRQTLDVLSITGLDTVFLMEPNADPWAVAS
jgi:anti-sigma B factor antagonist